MTYPREDPGGSAPPPPSQGLDPTLDRSMNGGGGGLILEVYCSL